MGCPIAEKHPACIAIIKVIQYLGASLGTTSAIGRWRLFFSGLSLSLKFNVGSIT